MCSRFKIGDRARVNITIGSIYDKVGTIIGYGQMQCVIVGQLYDMPNWKIKLDDGNCIEINEQYLNRVKD